MRDTQDNMADKAADLSGTRADGTPRRPKSLSSFKKELANVLKNGPNGKLHNLQQPKLNDQQHNVSSSAAAATTTANDTELYQDTSTLELQDDLASTERSVLPAERSTVVSSVPRPTVTQDADVVSLRRKSEAFRQQSNDEDPYQDCRTVELGQASFETVATPGGRVRPMIVQDSAERSRLLKMLKMKQPSESNNTVHQDTSECVLDERKRRDQLGAVSPPQTTTHQVHIKRKSFRPSECITSSDDDEDGDDGGRTSAKSEVQYSKLQPPAEQKKGFLARLSFGRPKARADPAPVDAGPPDGAQPPEAPTKITLEQPGESGTDFDVEPKDTASGEKRGILGIGGQLRKSLFKRRSRQHPSEKQKEGPLQQIRPDDDLDSDSESDDVPVFAPTLQLLDDGAEPRLPTVSETDTENPRRTSLLASMRLSSKKKTPTKPPAGPTDEQQDLDASRWYFSSVDELNRATRSSSLTHVSKISLQSSAPEQTTIINGKHCEGNSKDGLDDDDDDDEGEIKESGTNESKSQSVPKKSDTLHRNVSALAQKALEDLRQTERSSASQGAAVNPAEEDNCGLRQYFEDVLPGSAEETKKTKPLSAPFQWFRRGARRKPDVKPAVQVELPSIRKTSDVGVQFPEIIEGVQLVPTTKQQDTSQPPQEQKNQIQVEQPQPQQQQLNTVEEEPSPTDSMGQLMEVSQELLWKVPAEPENTHQERDAEQDANKLHPMGAQPRAPEAPDLVFRCPSVNEDFPVVQASHPRAADYVPGDSLLTLSSLDLNEHKSPEPPSLLATPVYYGAQPKPPKIPIFAACCPAPMKPVDLSVPYGSSAKDSLGPWHRPSPTPPPTPNGTSDDSDRNPDPTTRRDHSKRAGSKGERAAMVNHEAEDLVPSTAKESKKANKQAKTPREAGVTGSKPATVSLVKTVAKQVVVKLRERDQRKKQRRGPPLLSVFDLSKKRRWRSWPELTAVTSATGRGLSASYAAARGVRRSQDSVDEQFLQLGETRRASV